MVGSSAGDDEAGAEGVGGGVRGKEQEIGQDVGGILGEVLKLQIICNSVGGLCE